MLCEMCGAESASLEPRKVSGSVLRVCTSCAGMGKQTSYRESVGHRAFVAQTLEKREQKTRYKDISSDEKVLVSNYGDVVRKARERKGLDHRSLAMKISEKKSIITSVESGNMKPNEKLIKKQLFFKGESIQVKVKKPFKVIVGNADAVIGSYNNELIDFTTYANRLRVSKIEFKNE